MHVTYYCVRYTPMHHASHRPLLQSAKKIQGWVLHDIFFWLACQNLTSLFQLSRLPNAKFVSCRKSPLYHFFWLVPRAATTTPANATANDLQGTRSFSRVWTIGIVRSHPRSVDSRGSRTLKLIFRPQLCDHISADAWMSQWSQLRPANSTLGHQNLMFS